MRTEITQASGLAILGRAQVLNCASPHSETNYVIACGFVKSPARSLNSMVESQIANGAEAARRWARSNPAEVAVPIQPATGSGRSAGPGVR